MNVEEKIGGRLDGEKGEREREGWVFLYDN